jgi:hypothetical protein
MILNEFEIERLKDFILRPATIEEARRCRNCNCSPDECCTNKDICDRYSQTEYDIEEDSPTKRLVDDLLDTIEHLGNVLDMNGIVVD